MGMAGVCLLELCCGKALGLEGVLSLGREEGAVAVFGHVVGHDVSLLHQQDGVPVDPAPDPGKALGQAFTLAQEGLVKTQTLAGLRCRLSGK